MEEHDVELKLDAAIERNETKCPPLTLHPTKVPHVFTAVDTTAAPARHLLAAPTAAEVDPHLETQVWLATLRHQMRRTTRGQQPGCQAAGRPIWHTQVVAVALPRFSTIRGDAFVTFECHQPMSSCASPPPAMRISQCTSSTK